LVESATVADDASVTTTSFASTTTSLSPATTVAADPFIPEVLRDFAVERIELDGIELLVAIADTSELRRQGLMNVEDLGDLDGMLFVFAADSSGGFWMKDTLIPLDIAFFAADGVYVDGFVMEPCTTDDCPTYRPRGPYRYALEMPAGDMPATVATLSRDE
jgi:uncharacterized membrane protein (UPF0127 family)